MKCSNCGREYPYTEANCAYDNRPHMSCYCIDNLRADLAAANKRIADLALFWRHALDEKDRAHRLAVADRIKAEQDLAAANKAHDQTKNVLGAVQNALKQRTSELDDANIHIQALQQIRDEKTAECHTIAKREMQAWQDLAAERAKREQAEAQLAAKHGIIKSWQNFCQRLAERLGCMGTDAEVEDAAQRVMAERDTARAQVERMRIATWDGAGPRPACWRECERLRDQVERLRELCDAVKTTHQYVYLLDVSDPSGKTNQMNWFDAFKQALADTATSKETP